MPQDPNKQNRIPFTKGLLYIESGILKTPPNSTKGMSLKERQIKAVQSRSSFE
jgi:hypothetical protein